MVKIGTALTFMAGCTAMLVLTSCLAFRRDPISEGTLHAHRIELTDAAGRVRLILSAIDGPGISVLDAGGTRQISLGTFEDHPGFFMRSRRGRIGLGIPATSGPGLTLRDGSQHVDLYTGSQESGTVFGGAASTASLSASRSSASLSLNFDRHSDASLDSGSRGASISLSDHRTHTEIVGSTQGKGVLSVEPAGRSLVPGSIPSQ